uniref:Glycosyltransferase n=1 Tax=Wollemia nobilis TaxID=56998 RepID=A0A0C9RYE3_9CONI
MKEGVEDSRVDALAFPLLAQGHIIPFMELCQLLSSKNLRVVLLTSPLNAKRLRTTNTASSTGVQVMDIAVPRMPGLPEGAESTDHLPPPLSKLLLGAMEQMDSSLRQLLARLRPSCIIADFSPLCLAAIAEELEIPLLYYATMGAYSLSIVHSLINILPLPAADDDDPLFVLPGLPKPVTLRDSDLLPPYRGAGKTEFPHGFLSTVFDRLRHCSGLVINTFNEMEAEFVDHIQETFGIPVWTICPPICPPRSPNPNPSGYDGVISWLDSRNAGSVLYVNFGSEIALSAEQTKELAAGLEASGHYYLWAVKKPVDVREEDDLFLPPGFRERTAGRGLVMAGWAPQKAILRHPSTGGFLSHCGWNSVLESLSEGVPILAWPFQHDQPFVKKLLVEELQVAEESGNNGMYVVKSGEVERAVRVIMEGETSAEMRRRACELKADARRAVSEGGSSFTSLEKLSVFVRNLLNVQS